MKKSILILTTLLFAVTLVFANGEKTHEWFYDSVKPIPVIVDKTMESGVQNIETPDGDEEGRKEAAINMFLMINQKYFKVSDAAMVRVYLEKLSTEQIQMMMNLNFINPTTNTIISVLVGELGIDRFVLGQVGWGILKLVSQFFVVGVIWDIVDWFRISGLTKKHNMEKFLKQYNNVLLYTM